MAKEIKVQRVSDVTVTMFSGVATQETLLAEEDYRMVSDEDCYWGLLHSGDLTDVDAATGMFLPAGVFQDFSTDLSHFTVSVIKHTDDGSLHVVRLTSKG